MNYDFKVLAISEAEFANFVTQELAFNNKLASLTAADSTGSDEEEQSRLLSIYDNVAVVDIKGSLVNRDSPYNRYFGRISYSEIREAIIQAMEAEVQAIVFSVDSPGGTVDGVSDTANLIASLDMPTLSFTSGSMASAAYFLGSQADSVYAGDFATVGSIGVVAKLYDRSKMLAEHGIKPIRFRSGALKAVGDPDFSLSKKEKDYLQAKVMNYANKFYDIVSDARGMPLAAMETYGITTGKTFIGDEAQKVNLVDGIKSFDDVMLEAFNLAEKRVDNSAKIGLSSY